MHIATNQVSLYLYLNYTCIPIYYSYVRGGRAVHIWTASSLDFSSLLQKNNPRYKFDRRLGWAYLDAMAERTIHVPAETQTTVFKRAASLYTD
jgi:hypothetical protein